jgi:hypothetical protein
MEAPVTPDPPLNVRHLVGRDVVEDDGDLAARIGPGEEVEEVEELGGLGAGRSSGS